MPKGTYKFEANSQLVVVNVSAKDKNGAPLDGLKASDFTVTEDGKPQQIKVFEFQRLEEAAAACARGSIRGHAGRQTGSAKPAAKAIAPAKAGEVKYKDRRLLVMFFDQAGMPVADQIRAQQAALKFLKTQMTPSDLVAMMTFSTDLNVLQDFTADRDLLTKVIKRSDRLATPGWPTAAPATTAKATPAPPSRRTTTEFNIFNTDRKLAALESAVQDAGQPAGEEGAGLFRQRHDATGIDNQAQLRATINAAIRNNVAFYPVDARGLVATAPLGDATQASPGGQGMYSGSSQRTDAEQFPGQQETLYTLAADTGGKALLDNNDLSLGHRAGAEGYLQLLHPGLLQHQHATRRPLPPHQGAG